MYYLVLAFIFFGEFLVIYSEQLGAKLYGLGTTSFLSAFTLTVLPALVGVFFLVIGYMLGLKYHQNIWTVTAISFGSILIVEPFFNYFYIGQLPEFGSAVGFGFGVLGILAVTFL